MAKAVVVQPDHDFEIGDLVELKSGGPVMTVVGIAAASLRCGWFTEGEYLSGTFPSTALDRADGKGE